MLPLVAVAFWLVLNQNFRLVLLICWNIILVPRLTTFGSYTWCAYCLTKEPFLSFFSKLWYVKNSFQMRLIQRARKVWVRILRTKLSVYTGARCAPVILYLGLLSPVMHIIQDKLRGEGRNNSKITINSDEHYY